MICVCVCVCVCVLCGVVGSLVAECGIHSWLSVVFTLSSHAKGWGF